jgi:4-amino-4-deoxy-L-arabinose transferase-like glycosyltransferase
VFWAYTGIWMLFTLSMLWKKWGAARAATPAIYRFGLAWLILSWLALSLVAMKKPRYALPLCILSPLVASELLHYYWTAAQERLQRSDRILLMLQYGVIAAGLLAISGLLLAWAPGKIGWPASCALALLHLALFGAWLARTRPLCRRNRSRLILASGLLVVVLNLGDKWLIEWYSDGNRRTDLPLLEVLQQFPRGRPIYSAQFDVTDVWNAGRRIHFWVPQSLPADFDLLVIGVKPSWTGLPYQLVDQAKFYRNREHDEVVALYHLRRKPG